MTLFSAFALPWVFLFLAILNLPFVGALVRRFRLSQAERRNHALEHGTIYFLLKRRGAKRGVGGSAEPAGFRISGAKDEAEIATAFRDLIGADEVSRWQAVVSNRCGSMLVIAQGVGVVLLFLTLVGFSVRQPPRTVLASILGTQVLLVAALSRPLGRLIQRRRLLSLDFVSAMIADIKRVQREPLLEKSPVFFVRTHVS